MQKSEEKFFPDYMGCKNNKEILAQLDTDKGEEVVFSCVVVKFNRWGIRQDRTLLLTNQNLFNIKKDHVQRRIGVQSIKAVTKSTNPNNNQFIVHVKSEYDYIFESDYRKEIFDAIKYVFWKSNGTNLPVYGVPDKLKEYHTSKKDIQNGIEVNPQENFRLTQEDVYKEQAGAKPVVTAAASDSSSSFDDISMFNQEFQKIRSDTLFMKNKNEKRVDLKDFQIKSVIGKGSFGKVFLVQKVQDGEVFAMKSLRKDVILDYDQIESTLLEKEILLKADHPFLVGMEYVFQTD